MRYVILFSAIVMVTGTVEAAVKTEVLEYKHGDVVLQGYIAYDDATDAKRPGVLVVHQWRGLGDYEKRRARQLAERGYVALAADIYGKGVRPKNTQEARAQATKYRSDRQLMRERAQAGLATLKAHPLCDPERTAAIGYCFGGGVVLELARSGADLKGVVSFHGNLDTPDPSDAKNIKASIAVMHGADDPHVPTEQVLAFQKEMRDAGVDWMFTAFGGAVHSFTDSGAGNDPSRGSAYNAKADRRSWEIMKVFFEEVLK